MKGFNVVAKSRNRLVLKSVSQEKVAKPLKTQKIMLDQIQIVSTQKKTLNMQQSFFPAKVIAGTVQQKRLKIYEPKKTKSKSERSLRDPKQLHFQFFLKKMLGIRKIQTNKVRFLQLIYEYILDDQKIKEELVTFMEEIQFTKYHILPASPQASELLQLDPIAIYQTLSINLQPIISKDTMTIQQRLQHIQQQKQQIEKLHFEINQKELSLKSINHQLSQKSHQLQVYEEKTRQMQQSIRLINKQLLTCLQKQQQLNVNYRKKSFQQIQELANNFNYQQSKIKQYSVPYVPPVKSNEIKSLQFVQQESMREFQNILMSMRSYQSAQLSSIVSQKQRKLEVFLKEVIKNYELLINKLIECNTDKENYIRQFQEDLESYLKIEKIKIETIECLKRDYSILFTKVDSIFQKYIYEPFIMQEEDEDDENDHHDQKNEGKHNENAKKSLLGSEHKKPIRASKKSLTMKFSENIGFQKKLKSKISSDFKNLNDSPQKNQLKQLEMKTLKEHFYAAQEIFKLALLFQ